VSGDEGLLATVLQNAIPPSSHVAVLREGMALADELSGIAKRRGDLRRLGWAAAHRCHGAYVFGEPGRLEAARTDLGRVVREMQDPYWRWTAYLIDTSRLLMECDFAGSARLLAEGLRLEHRFERGPGRAGRDGPWSLQAFVVRRETGGLDFARRLLDRLDEVENPWRPGLVALFTELGMAERGRAHLRAAVERDLPVLLVAGCAELPRRGCCPAAGP
jgi:hypothetical protein